MGNILLYKRNLIEDFMASTQAQRQPVFIPQLLRAVGVLFHPWCLDGRAGGRREIVCSGCISETIRCRKFILGRDVGCRV